MNKETKCMGVSCDARNECFRFFSLDFAGTDIVFRGTLEGMETTGCTEFYSINDGLYEYSRMQGLTPKQVHSRMAELAGGHEGILKKYGYGK